MEGYREDKARLSSEVYAERTRGNGHKLQQGEFWEDMKEELFSTLHCCSTGTGAWSVCGISVFGDCQHSADENLKPHDLTLKWILLSAEVGLDTSRDPFQPKWFYNSNKQRHISVFLTILPSRGKVDPSNITSNCQAETTWTGSLVPGSQKLLQHQVGVTKVELMLNQNLLKTYVKQFSSDILGLKALSS